MHLINLRFLSFVSAAIIGLPLVTSCGGGSYCEKLQSSIEKDSEERASIPFTPNRKYFDVPPEKYQETANRYDELGDRISVNKQAFAETCAQFQNP